MRFSTFTILGLSAAILVACNGQTSVDYRLTFDTQDPATVEELSKATIRVMQRRLERLNAEVLDQSIVRDADGVTLSLTISDSTIAQTLTEEMTAPFDMQIMLQAESATGADIAVEGMGGFNGTGITGKDLSIVRSGKNPETSGGYVLIPLTEKGLTVLRDVFTRNVGKNLGLFVRGNLVSTLAIKSADLPNPLVIDGVPDAELAAIFADDVNVGNHVTVSPL